MGLDEQATKFLKSYADYCETDQSIYKSVSMASKYAQEGKNKEAIEQRMALIEQLESSRNAVPIVLDELVRLVPHGLSFRSFSRQGNLIEILGVSESNNRLADFMRQLQDSTVFSSGELSSIKADTSALEAVSDFKLTFTINPSVAPDFSAVNVEQKK